MSERAVYGVFAGGGVKGIALAGAAAGAMELGLRFEQIVGTSSGALVGSLVAAGYSPTEMDVMIPEIPWPDLTDVMPGGRLPIIGRHVSLVLGNGHHRGDRLERTLRALLRGKQVRRFGDLAPGSLRVVATDITHQRGVVLPDDLPTYGIVPERFSVARAVRMSSAVPFFFRPVPLHDLRRNDSAMLVDGALTANFPLRVAPWDGHLPVVGIRFKDGNGHEHLNIRGPASLARAVVTAAIRAARTVDNPLLRRALVLELEIDRDPLDFNVGPAEARRMYRNGREAALRFFSEHASVLPGSEL